MYNAAGGELCNDLTICSLMLRALRKEAVQYTSKKPPNLLNDSRSMQIIQYPTPIRQPYPTFHSPSEKYNSEVQTGIFSAPLCAQIFKHTAAVCTIFFFFMPEW